MIQLAPIRSPRRWLTFKLSTLFLAVTVAAIVLGYPHLYRHFQFQRFKTFADQDIRKLSEQERQQFSGIVKWLLPAARLPLFDFHENWFVWRLPTARGDRFVLFQGDRIMTIPGTSNAHVYLFNSSGRLVGQSSFSTGWRIDIIDAALVTDKIDGQSLIRVTTEPVINGADIATQYYAVLNDTLVLLRLENSSGESIPNEYAAPNHTIGPETAIRTRAEWSRALADPSPIEILRTLVWLGGHHYGQPIKNPGNIHIEDFDAATLHLSVREHPDTRPALEALATNDNSWISDAARLALRSLDDSP